MGYGAAYLRAAAVEHFVEQLIEKQKVSSNALFGQHPKVVLPVSL